MNPVVYSRGDELPALELEWSDSAGDPVDLSSGTFTLTLTDRSTDDTAAVTKTTGITGSVDGIATVAWAVGELDITEGNYRLRLVHRNGASLDRTWPGKLDVVIS